MRAEAETSGLSACLDHGLDQIARATSEGMRRAVEGLKEDLRNETYAAGLGLRVANAWQGSTFPDKGRISLDPAGYVWTNTPRIVDGFVRGATIRPVAGGRYLWIPTDNVPIVSGSQRADPSRRGRGPATPYEVELLFNQDLILRRWRGGRMLAFVEVIKARTQRTGRRNLRRATPGRLAQGRKVERILMFVLVRSVKLRSLIDPQAAGQRWAARVPALIAAAWTD